MTDKPESLPATPTLMTARLLLRPLRWEDAPALQRRFPKWEIVRHLNDKIPWPYPPDGAEAHLREFLPQMEARKCFAWAITLPEAPDELIGRIDLRPEDWPGEQRGFWLDVPYWGQGLMTEAADRVTEYAFLELGWPSLRISNAESNAASHRIKEKQGGQIIERVRARFAGGEDWKIIWLITREDWLASRGRRA